MNITAIAPFIMVIAIVAIVHHYKLEMMKFSASSQRGSQDLESKIEALREDYQQFILGFDARLKRLESRIAGLEGERQQAALPQASQSFTPVNADAYDVQVGSRRVGK